VLCVETPESREQVYMYRGGVLEVHDNVVFEANTAATRDGGAVRFPFYSGSHMHVGLFCYTFCGGWFSLLRELTKPRR
jgi:predicted outer membrane repeat protein